MSAIVSLSVGFLFSAALMKLAWRLLTYRTTTDDLEYADRRLRDWRSVRLWSRPRQTCHKP